MFSSFDRNYFFLQLKSEEEYQTQFLKYGGGQKRNNAHEHLQKRN